MSNDIRAIGNLEVTVYVVMNPLGIPTRIFFTELEAKKQLLDDMILFQEKSSIDPCPLFVTKEAVKRLELLIEEDRKRKKP